MVAESRDQAGSEASDERDGCDRRRRRQREAQEGGAGFGLHRVLLRGGWGLVAGGRTEKSPPPVARATLHGSKTLRTKDQARSEPSHFPAHLVCGGRPEELAKQRLEERREDVVVLRGSQHAPQGSCSLLRVVTSLQPTPSRSLPLPSVLRTPRPSVWSIIILRLSFDGCASGFSIQGEGGLQHVHQTSKGREIDACEPAIRLSEPQQHAAD